MKIFASKKIFSVITLIVLMMIIVLIVLNLDILLRAIHSFQNGTLTQEKIRLDIAAFDLGQSVPPLPANAKTSAMDGMMQVNIPAGEFTMGNGTDNDTFSHIVYLDEFWMDRVEVTNTMYKLCIAAKGCTLPADDNVTYTQWIYRDHPITYVTWYEATEYCQWAGRRLPTEAEWEKAARGTDERKYPWGNMRATARLANFEETMIHESLSSFRYPLGASPYGVLNMSGNVREWVADWFDANYYVNSPYKNPKGPENGTERSLRSGSYNEDAREIFVYRRYNHEPQSPGLSRGFRCAQDADINQ